MLLSRKKGKREGKRTREVRGIRATSGILYEKKRVGKSFAVLSQRAQESNQKKKKRGVGGGRRFMDERKKEDRLRGP